MGLTWLAPGVFYPPHAHDAKEVYQMSDALKGPYGKMIKRGTNFGFENGV